MANFEARRIVRDIVAATVVEPVQQTARVARDSAQILSEVGIGVSRRIANSEPVRRGVRRAQDLAVDAVVDVVTRGIDAAVRVTEEVHTIRRRMEDQQ